MPDLPSPTVALMIEASHNVNEEVGWLDRNLTAQEWHQEHLEFMARTPIYLTSDVDYNAIEAASFFDQAGNGLNHRPVMCPRCMELLVSHRAFYESHQQCACGHEFKGAQAIAAAYYSLLQLRHSDCELSDEAFLAKCMSYDDLIQSYREFAERSSHLANVAEHRALVLFKTLFGLRKYNQLCRAGEVTFQIGATFYRLFWARHGNVAVYDRSPKLKTVKPISAYCGHFGERLPITDNLIAQILMLKTNPNRYFDSANEVKQNDFQYSGPEMGYQDLIRAALATEL